MSEIPYGYCHCGCGGKTEISKYTKTSRGWVKGEPRKFINHHHEHIIDVVERFWSKIKKTDDPDRCWEWTSTSKTTGYGSFALGRDGKHMVLAHRFAYQITFGEIPNGLYVCHKCDNRVCCNPNHLFLGTHQDNMDDMYLKGRRAMMRGEQHSAHILTENQVRRIRKLFSIGNVSQVQLAHDFGVHPATISGIVNRRKWKHI